MPLTDRRVFLIQMTTVNLSDEWPDSIQIWMTNQTELIWLIQLYWNHFILSSYSGSHITRDHFPKSKEWIYSMTLILEHTRVQKGTPVHVFDLSTKWQVILFYDLIKIFIINSIYKYCIWTYSNSFLKINLWLLCYNWWSSRIRIRFVGWFRIISALILKDRPFILTSRHGLKLRYRWGRSTQTIHLNFCQGKLEPRTKKKVCLIFSICTYLKYFSRF